MALWRRPSGEGFVYAFIIIVVAILLLAFWGWFTGRWEADSAPVAELAPSKYDDHLLELDKQTLERAYQAQVQLIFLTWLKDDITTTYRVENGLRIARRAYIHAANQLEKRAAEVAARERKK